MKFINLYKHKFLFYFCEIKILFFAAMDTLRRPWLPTSRTPHDREVKERELRDDVGTLPNHSGGGGRGGTLRNQFDSRQRGRTRHSRSAHKANNADSMNIMKVIESSLRTQRPVHRLLVVSTVCFLIYSALIYHLLLDLLYLF